MPTRRKQIAATVFFSVGIAMIAWIGGAEWPLALFVGAMVGVLWHFRLA